MNILITGHRGYIGSHLRRLLPGADGVDLRDGNNLICGGGVIPAGPHDTVFHLAALATVSESVNQPLRYWGNNVGITQALLSSLVCRGFTGRIVFASTLLAAFPESSPYAATKDACERMIRQTVRRHGMSAVILRLGNVAGGGDATPGRLWVELARAVREGEPFRVAGNGDSIVRDYIHVLDVCSAFLAASQHPIRPGETIALDIGTGFGSTVSDCLEVAERVIGQPIARQTDAARPGDIAWSVADPEPAACLLGWRARVSLPEIAAEALASFASAPLRTA